MADGNGRIITLNGGLARNAKDEQGRTLRHNATVQDAHEIAIEEGNKVHAFYLDQIPPFVARMIQDALMSYGLIPPPVQVGDAAGPTASDASKYEVGETVSIPLGDDRTATGTVVESGGGNITVEFPPVAPMEDTAP